MMKINFKLIFAVALTGCLVACGGKKDESKIATTTKKEVEKVKVLALQNEKVAKSLQLSATLEGYETMNISPSVTGLIDHIYVEVGSRDGDLLARNLENGLGICLDSGNLLLSEGGYQGCNLLFRVHNRCSSPNKRIHFRIPYFPLICNNSRRHTERIQLYYAQKFPFHDGRWMREIFSCIQREKMI